MSARAAIMLLLVAAAAARALPLVESTLPFNVDGFQLAASADEALSTGRWVPDDHESSRPAAPMLLAAVAAATGLPPLEVAQLLFSLVGVLAVAATALAASSVLEGPRRAHALGALALLALFGSHVYFSAATMKQALGLALLPLALALVLCGRSRRERAWGGALVVGLVLVHHFVAFVAIGALGLALVAMAARSGWRRAPRDALAALLAAALALAAWVLWLREPIGSSSDLLARDAGLYASVWALAAFAIHLLARRPPTPRTATSAFVLLAGAGVAALLLHSAAPVFAGTAPAPMGTLLATPFLGVALCAAAWGIARVLGGERPETVALVLGVLGSVVAALAFAALRGLDAASYYLAQRAFDLAALALAVGYAAAWGARATLPRAGRVAVAALLLAAPALTFPIALADADGLSFGEPVRRDEAAAIAWAAAAGGPIATDTRLGFVLEQAHGIEASRTAAFDLAQGAPVAGLVVASASWETRGGELKPLGLFVVDLDQALARCPPVYRAGDAVAAYCT